MIKKSTLITATAALFLGLGIGVVIPVASNSNFEIKSKEEALALLEGTELANSFSKENIIENEIVEESKEVEESQELIDAGIDEPLDSSEENEQSVNEEQVSNRIILEYDPDEIEVLGCKFGPTIIDDICNKYNVPNDMGNHRQDLEGGDYFKTSTYETDQQEKHITQRILRICNSSNDEIITILKVFCENDPEWKNSILLLINGDKVKDDKAICDLVNEYARVPFVLLSENDTKKWFHIDEVDDLSKLSAPEGVSVSYSKGEANLKEVIEDSYCGYTIEMGTYIVRAYKYKDNKDNYYLSVRYILD